MLPGLLDGFIRLDPRRLEVVLLLILAALRIVGVDTPSHLRLPLSPQLIVHLLQFDDAGLVKIGLLAALRAGIYLSSSLAYF